MGSNAFLYLVFSRMWKFFSFFPDTILSEIEAIADAADHDGYGGNQALEETYESTSSQQGFYLLKFQAHTTLAFFIHSCFFSSFL